jgi:hypothetical protein
MVIVDKFFCVFIAVTVWVVVGHAEQVRLVDRIPSDCIRQGTISFTCPMLTLPIRIKQGKRKKYK